MPALSGEVADPGQYNTDIRKRIARADRTTTSSTTTSEGEVLRIDGIPLKSGRTYQLHTSSLLVQSTVANDSVVAKIRISTTGTATIAASTDLGEGIRRCTGASVLEETHAKVSYSPASDETLSLLLTVVRGAGTGSVSIYGAANAHIELYCDDMGTDPGNTGVSL
jgi:hypothetical protein